MQAAHPRWQSGEPAGECGCVSKKSLDGQAMFHQLFPSRLLEHPERAESMGTVSLVPKPFGVGVTGRGNELVMVKHR